MSETAKAHKHGLTALSTLEFGKTIKQVGWVDFLKLMAMCIMANGNMIKRMGLGSICIATVANTSANGKTIYLTATAMKLGTTIQNIRAFIARAANMDSVYTSGRTDQNIQGSGIRMIWKGLEYMNGRTVGVTKDIGIRVI